MTPLPSKADIEQAMRAAVGNPETGIVRDSIPAMAEAVATLMGAVADSEALGERVTRVLTPDEVR